MADHSAIEWTDATWNPITGCSVVSAGCKHCYAMKLAGTRMRNHPSRAGLTIDTVAGPVWNGQVRLNEEWLDQPLRWRRPRRIFVCAHGDLFHESVPDEWIAAVFGVMAAAPHHTFQVLTKRPERMRTWFAWREEQIRARELTWEPWRVCEEQASERVENLPAIGCTSTWPLQNVWLGVSVENQDAADERIPLLLQTPAAVRWISAEPLLGPVDLAPKADETYAMLSQWYGPNGFDPTGTQPRSVRMSGYFPRIDWVVVGGESGDKARPMHPDWARSLRDQCATAGVPILLKQWGHWEPVDAWGPWSRFPLIAIRADGSRMPAGEWHEDGQRFRGSGKKKAGRLLDGITHDGYPEVRSGNA